MRKPNPKAIPKDLVSILRRPPLPRFRSRLHDERTATLIGTALGVAFAAAFVTGLISHVLQHPPSWLAHHLPTRPSWGYRFTQGLHVASGTAAIPLLLAKLWTVYPRLFAWPPLKSVAHALERLSILVLVAGAIFELVTGLLNSAQWYVWGNQFPFIQTHYRVAWITVGALVVHLGVKAPAIARGYRNPKKELPQAQVRDVEERRDGVSRRAFIATTAVAAGTVTVATVGQSVDSLRPVSVLSPRDIGVGELGVPVNRTAGQAGITEAAVTADWRLQVDGGTRQLSLSRQELAALPQTSATLPIACVEGWSVDAHWQGVRISDLMDMAGIPHDADVRVVSMEENGAYAVMVMEREYVRDPAALLALRLNGQTLTLDHGYPARIIVPNRPGVLQTKWVRRMEAIV
ncbi:molybdopterin-dependent oxidoreductase [Catenulispora sp. GP43]|uniref:molybdopterin-dependent oxidoreductase n=1 Tax=Catenulispora sp. GP43 TaxID=3156263 RepID=UPI003512B74C